MAQWSQFNHNCILVQTEQGEAYMVWVNVSKIDSINMREITTIKWHPRKSNILLIAQKRGRLCLYDIEKKAAVINYEIKGLENVIDVQWNPGEEVFIALFED